MYNMNKYIIEYPNKGVCVCFDDVEYNVNLILKHKDEEYLFVEYANDNNSLNFAIKRIFKLIDKTSALYEVFTIIIDKFNTDPERYEKDVFVFTVLPENDRNLKYYKKDYACVHIFTNDKY